MASANVAPQSEAREMLRRALANGRLGHAYLFDGELLTPLEEAALDLAQTLNCSRPPERAPNGVPMLACKRCKECLRVAAYQHPDVTWIRPESKLRQISIAQIRELIHAISLKPLGAGYKMGI